MPLNKTAITKTVIPYPDVTNGQPMHDYIFDGNNKAIVDKLDIIGDSVNNLKTTLYSAVDGDSGANNITVTPISGVNGTTVQAVAESLKQTIDNTTLGQLPDASITTAKLNPDLVKVLPFNYVSNKIPTSAQNFASGYRVGDTIDVPAMTLHNKVPTPETLNFTNFTIQNANTTVSGDSITLACLAGFNYSSLKFDFAPIAGHEYIMFADVKITSTNVMTKIELGTDIVNSPVKDTVYHMCKRLTAPAYLEVKVSASTPAIMNGATVVMSKITVIDMTADMPLCMFDEPTAKEYFSVNTVTKTSSVFTNNKTRWYCTGNGVWQNTDQISKTVATLYGLDTASVEEIIALLPNARWMGKASQLSNSQQVGYNSGGVMSGFAVFTSIRDDYNNIGVAPWNKLTIPPGAKTVDFAFSIWSSRNTFGTVDATLWKNGVAYKNIVSQPSGTVTTSVTMTENVVPGDYFQIYMTGQDHNGDLGMLSCPKFYMTVIS